MHNTGPHILDNVGAAVKEQMHAKHRLGSAPVVGQYYNYWKNTLPQVVRGPSNQHMTDASLNPAEVRAIIRYRTGTLYNAKHARWFGHRPATPGPATCPLCGHADGGLHILSGCTHPTISKMVTERHNEAGRKIVKAIMKGAYGASLVAADVGARERLDVSHIDIDISTRHMPAWLLDQTKYNRIPEQSRPDAVMVMPKNTGVHCPRHPRRIPKGKRRVVLIEIKYCGDTQRFTTHCSNATACQP
jgi:hypothetical protein